SPPTVLLVLVALVQHHSERGDLHCLLVEVMKRQALVFIAAVALAVHGLLEFLHFVLKNGSSANLKDNEA
ncbi:hypothetical protein PFISCL1PPCAC_3765, partial [Pristionchus fissidentatus]